MSNGYIMKINIKNDLRKLIRYKPARLSSKMLIALCRAQAKFGANETRKQNKKKIIYCLGKATNGLNMLTLETRSCYKITLESEIRRFSKMYRSCITKMLMWHSNKNKS